MGKRYKIVESDSKILKLSEAEKTSDTIIIPKKQAQLDVRGGKVRVVEDAK
jgi:hypothetical protein